MNTTMSLSKVIPRRVVTQRFRWVRRDFLLFGRYKAARQAQRLPLQSKCWWCNTPFADADMLAMAAPEKGKNRLICQRCAAELEAQQASPATQTDHNDGAA